MTTDNEDQGAPPTCNTTMSKAVDAFNDSESPSTPRKQPSSPRRKARGGKRNRRGGGRGGGQNNQSGGGGTVNNGRGYRGDTVNGPKKSSPANVSSLHSSVPNIRTLGENDDPLRLLWKAIHLDNDSADIPDLKPEDVINHDRLHGTLLAMADGRTRVDILQAASRLGVDLAAVKDNTVSWNLLHAAVSSGSLPVLKTLLQEATDEQIKRMINEYSALLGTTKWTPLLIAVKNGFGEAIEPLLNHGADPFLCVHLVTPDLADRRDGSIINKKEGQVFPFFFAVKNCSRESVQFIFEKMKEAQPSIKLRDILDSKSRTAIHYLSERPTGNGTTEIFQYLLSVDPEIHLLKDINGNSPLHESCLRGCDESTISFITVLTTVGIDVKTEAIRNNKDDVTPFLIAVATGMTGAVEALLSYCGDVIGPDPEIGTSIVKALERGEIMHAINLAAIHTTETDEFEKGAFNAFIGLTNEPDQAQLLRVVKRLGPYFCMSFIAEFTVADLTATGGSKTRRDNQKLRTKGGHFLTLLKTRLLKEDRHEDWNYIRVVTELTHKKMRGRQKRPVAAKDYVKTICIPRS